MKFIKILFTLVCIATTTSCNNFESIDDFANTQTDVISIDSFMQLESNTYEQRSPLHKTTRSSSTDFTVYKYTSKTTSRTYKVNCGKKLASLLHIYVQPYFTEYINAKYELTIDGLSNKTTRFSANNSPNCGLYPDYTEDELEDRGYSVTQKGNKITMTTRIIHIISSLDGKSYDKWYPCKPEDLQWNYNIYKE